MHCPFFKEMREAMFKEISNLETLYTTQILSPLDNNLHVMLGKVPPHVNPEMMLYFYKLVAKNVHHMYKTVLANREGIG